MWGTRWQGQWMGQKWFVVWYKTEWVRSCILSAWKDYGGEGNESNLVNLLLVLNKITIHCKLIRIMDKLVIAHMEYLPSFYFVPGMGIFLAQVKSDVSERKRSNNILPRLFFCLHQYTFCLRCDSYHLPKLFDLELYIYIVALFIYLCLVVLTQRHHISQMEIWWWLLLFLAPCQFYN